MARVKLKDGPLERIVQAGLRHHGFKFQKHVKSLPGSPDLVFPKAKVAVFVDGDFWHGWHLPKWEHKLTSFWKEKIQTNRRRDRKNFRRLRQMGWYVIRIWQHQLKRDRASCVAKIEKVIELRSK